MKREIIILGIAMATFVGCKKDKEQPTNIVISTRVENLTNPWGMVFLPNGDLVFTERTGKISILKHGESNTQLLMNRNVEVSEGGLLGLAVDPQFSTNHYLYIYETIVDENRVVRLAYNNGSLAQDAVILNGIPASYNHDGGALRFGPDGYLYVGTGDALQGELAQDKNSLAGKILRIDRNGNAAPGNPFNSVVWSYGHRNVQGFDWNPQGVMLATEHGPSSENGWCCHDEINRIQPGKNYGWPLVIGDTQADTLTAPIYHTGNNTWAPSGCSFIKGNQWKTWQNNLAIGAMKAERIYLINLSTDGGSVVQIKDTLNGTYDRIRNIIQAPDGSLYFATSNNSGDKIVRMSME